MITIEGTKKIKGALDLAGINKQLKAGDHLPITDDEYRDHSVQIAIQMGFLTEHRDNKELPTGIITLKNIYDRSIRVNSIEKEIRPGQTFSLTGDEVNTADIRGALAKGLLAIVSSAKVASGKEATVRVGDLFEEKEVSQNTEEISVIPNDFLETNEEIIPNNVIDTETPKPVQKSDLLDPKQKSVVWNPNKEPVVHTLSGMDSISANNSNLKDVSSSEDEIADVISFVDKEMDDKKLKSHPILKDKPLDNNDELDFL